jgi:hypothetical protein
MEGTAARFSWKQAPDLMARLTAAQNHPANVAQDIMTFAGFCASRAELEAHVVRYETIAANWVAPKRGRRAA